MIKTKNPWMVSFGDFLDILSRAMHYIIAIGDTYFGIAFYVQLVTLVWFFKFSFNSRNL